MIVCPELDYKAWKNDEMLLDATTNNLIDMVAGITKREKVLKHCQKSDYDRFSPYPNSFEDLTRQEKKYGAWTYSEFKEMTEHIEKKVVNGVISLLVKDVV